MKPVSNPGRCRLRWVSQLLDGNGAWNHELVTQLFLPVDCEAILSIKASPRLGPDFIAWQPERLGIFTVKSAYKLGVDLAQFASARASSSLRPDGSDPCWKKIWSSIVPPKVKVFAWRAASNALATEVKKRHRGIQVTGVCSICGMEAEDVLHALRMCPHAKLLWDQMRQVWKLPGEYVLSLPRECWLRACLDKLSMEESAYLLMLLWRIWYARNEVTHEKPLPPPDVSRRFLCGYMSSLLSIRIDPLMDVVKGKQQEIYFLRPWPRTEKEVVVLKNWAIDLFCERG